METDRNRLAASLHRRNERQDKARVAVARPDADRGLSWSGALLAELAVALLLGNVVGLIQS